MTAFLGILTFFVILSVLVVAHELGHFTFAKLFKVRVDEFGVGFPPRVKGWRRGETLYSINALPLGGFVKMMGENGEEDSPSSFGAKPAWQRFIILVAGPTMNLIVAILILSFAFMAGVQRESTVVTAVQKGTPAARAGLLPNDRIVAIGRSPVTYGDDLVSNVLNERGKVLRVQVQRGSRTLTFHVLARSHPPNGQGSFGIRLGATTTQHFSPAGAVGQSFDALGTMVASIPTIFQNLASPNSGQVEGPIGIAQVTTSTVQQAPRHGPSQVFLLMALLSLNLGVLNLLPFPALDGGRIVFVLLSAMRRRNLDPQLEGAIHAAGMAFLLMLIVLISYHDIVRWITGASS